MIQFSRHMLEFYKVSLWTLQLIIRAAGLDVFILFLVVFFQGLIPGVSLISIQAILFWMTSSSTFPFIYLGLWATMLIADLVLTPIMSIVRLRVNEKMVACCNILLMEKANQILGLQPFEEPKFYDRLQFLRSESSRRPLNFVFVSTGIFKETITICSLAVVMASLAWWLPLAMIFCAIPQAISAFQFEKKGMDFLLFNSQDARKMNWLSSLTLDSKLAKEIRLFNFGTFLVEKYRETARLLNQALVVQRWSQALVFCLFSSTTVILNLVIIVWFLLQAKKGGFLFGSVVVVIQAILVTQSQLNSLISYIGMGTPVYIFFQKFREFLQFQFCSLQNEQPKIAVVGVSPFHEIRFENVSFCYPGVDGRKILSNLTFAIKKGEKIAIVGANGSGKSTLIKLLLRFYDPTEGKIIVDGADLKTHDLASWRSQISGIFQEFGRYHLSLKDNVCLGKPNSSVDRLEMALCKAGLGSKAKLLPDGVDTILGKEFGKTTLSGGEWQKLAMSRAFFRRAELLILDEPTAALDPESEHEFFNKFAEEAEGKTALLITHRLGSVKMADRIFVLKEGKLVEEGTHQNLMNARNEYAKYFLLQASQYETSAGPKQVVIHP